MLLLRSVFGTIGILCNFYAVDHLLVSDASMLNKLSPFFVIIFSSLFLKEKANFIQKLTIVIAFIGSLFVIKPSINFVSNMNSFIGVMGAMTAGIAYTCVRQLGKQGVVGAKIVFFFSCFSCLSVVPYLFFNYQPMSMQQVFYLLMAGLMAAGGQFSITSAYTYAPAKEISVYDYTQVLFAAVLGFVFLKQVPDVYSLVGYVIIIGVAFWNFQDKKRYKIKKCPCWTFFLFFQMFTTVIRRNTIFISHMHFSLNKRIEVIIKFLSNIISFFIDPFYRNFLFIIGNFSYIGRNVINFIWMV